MNLDQLSARPQPRFGPDLFERDQVIPEIQEKIGLQNLYAVAWQTESEPLNAELKDLQTWLKHLLTLPGVSLNWLADWVNSDVDLAPVGLQDFWGGDAAGGDIAVPAAFTITGKAKIDAVIDEIKAALFDPLIIAGQNEDFLKWYQASYFKAWQTFAQKFDEGRNLLKRREQWQTVAKRLPTDNGPYYGLIDRAITEFSAFGQDVKVPAWVGLAYDWQGIRETSRDTKPADLEKAGILRKATQKVKSKIKRAEKAFGVQVRAPLKAEDELSAAKAQQAYQQALEETVKAADSRNVAFKLASDLYQQDPVTGDSPMLAAHRSLDQLRTILADAQNEEEKLFWTLLAGNLTFMQTYLTREAACYLQDKWEKDVLMEVQGVSADKDMAQVMMGQGGYAEQFIKGPAAPFIGKSLAKGFYSKRTLDQAVDFDQDFLTYLDKGARAARPTQSSYKVRIRAYPTDTNTEATIRPHSTVLEMQCDQGKMRLENLNYPVAQTFTWSPSGCGDVVFQIAVGNLLLTKTYEGYNAFAKFLNDFKTGQKVFYRKAFPSEEAALRRIGINYIKVKYQFQGHKDVLQLLYSAPGKPPQRIVACWDR